MILRPLGRYVRPGACDARHQKYERIHSPWGISRRLQFFGGALAFGSGLGGFQEQKKDIWFDIALNGEDQLRQRVAWALNQILVVSPSNLGEGETEKWTSFYDIFVRHAFGNYRTILKEVSFSPM